MPLSRPAWGTIPWWSLVGWPGWSTEGQQWWQWCLPWPPCAIPQPLLPATAEPTSPAQFLLSTLLHHAVSLVQGHDATIQTPASIWWEKWHVAGARDMAGYNSHDHRKSKPPFPHYLVIVYFCYFSINLNQICSCPLAPRSSSTMSFAHTSCMANKIG